MAPKSAAPPCAGEIRLRRARDGDAREIAEIHVDSWRKSFRGVLPAPYLEGLRVEDDEQGWQRTLSILPADRRPWLAEIDGHAVAFATAGPSRDEDATSDVAEVYDIYVDPDCQDRGIGKTLLGHVVRDMRERGYDRLTVWCFAEAQDARRFYERSGWRHDGKTRSRPIGAGEVQEVRYQLAL